MGELEDRFHGDRPLGTGEADRLGFLATAERLARSLLSQTSKHGMVVGLEGKWGSGKSSLLFLLLQELERAPSKERPAIVRFEPWLIGDRDALLAALFTDLASAIEGLASGKPGAQMASKAAKVAEAVRSFGAGLGGLGKLARLAGLVVPGATFAADLLESAQTASAAFENGPSLAERKSALSKGLLDLDRRIVVAIDDIDRLDPLEALEVLRLIRSVADFPNVTYVICFDATVLADSISRAAKVSDGRAYLEKILQVVVPVPIPEPFDLRRWFREDLSAFATADTEARAAQLERVIDDEGGNRLLTPRSVVRALNGVRFAWPALRKDVDIGDLVFLQLIRASNLPLYRWIEEYCGNCAARSGGGVQIGAEEASRSYARLEKLLLAEGSTFGEAQYRLGEHLPAIGYSFTNEIGSVYADVSRKDLDIAIRDRRLASPDHYRLYFALSSPNNSPQQHDFDALLTASEIGPAEVALLLSEWNTTKLSSGASKFEVMLDRLSGSKSNPFSSKATENILAALANAMDDAPFVAKISEFGAPLLWNEATKLFEVLFRPLSSDQKMRVLRKMFGKGRALGWLTGAFRNEVFAHGRAGERTDPARAVMSSMQLDVVTKLMLQRYRSLAIRDLLSMPRPLSTLFAWLQAGDESGPRSLIDGAIKDDAIFLKVLEALAGTVVGNDGPFRRLSRVDAGHFIDYDAAQERVVALSESGSKTIRPIAKRIAGYFEGADD